MKTKLARVFYWLARLLDDWAWKLECMTHPEPPSVEEIQEIYQASYTRPSTINVTSRAQPPKAGDTVIVHCGDEELRYTCISTEPAEDGLGFDCKLEKIEAVDVFAGEQFKTKPEEKGEK